MRILLSPRPYHAYGQDFLWRASANELRLRVIQLNKDGYRLPDAQPALVVAHDLDDSATSRCIQNLAPSTPVVAHLHLPWHYCDENQQTNIREALAHVRSVIVPAEHMRRHLADSFPMIDWHVVHNGVDVALFRPADPDERADFRIRLSVGSDKKLALCVGRLDRPKGQDIIARYVSLLPGTGIQLIIQYPGYGPSGSIRKYEKVAGELKALCPDQVTIFQDHDPATDRPIRFSDLHLHTSLCESASLTVAQALVSGVPTVGTRSTPFFGDFSMLGIPSWGCHLVDLPATLLTVRADLHLDEEGATQIANDLMLLSIRQPVPTDRERELLSSSARAAGLSLAFMIERFRQVYEETELAQARPLSIEKVPGESPRPGTTSPIA